MVCRLAIILPWLFLSLSPAHAGESITTGFSPGNAAEVVEGAIAHAHQTIDVAAYEFTARDIADALIAAKQRGVVVQVVLDAKSNRKHHPAVDAMAAVDIPIRLNDRYAIMHDKFMVIDGKTVETGSFNYTASAERRNAENVIVIRDAPPLAKQYLENWQKLWDEGKNSQAAQE